MLPPKIYGVRSKKLESFTEKINYMSVKSSFLVKTANEFGINDTWMEV